MRLEVVCHDVPGTGPGSLRLAARTLALADRAGVPAVLTNAVRYADPGQHQSLIGMRQAGWESGESCRMTTHSARFEPVFGSDLVVPTRAVVATELDEVGTGGAREGEPATVR
ncbi:MAG: hypothetical protein HOY79_23940 [Streptomyces sp.]|nr:hypothetical protein [Streptomyces sp.]